MFLSLNSILRLIQLAIIFSPCVSIFHYTSLLNIALNKPLELEPKKLICGIGSKISLCDNRLEIGKSCNQFSSSVLYCDQSCPYGTIIKNFEAIESINLQKLSTCIAADRTYYMKNSPIKYSYLFSSNLCNREQNDEKSIVWTPFILNSIANNLFGQRSLSTFHDDEKEGFTMLIWFQQIGNRNGFVIEYSFIFRK